MACTTILVGKKASYDGSTLMARNEDSPAGVFTPVRFRVVLPSDQPRQYRSVLNHFEMTLPENPLRYTAVPDSPEKDGTWAAAGINSACVAMTATETITSNDRVLGADPLVTYRPAVGQPGEAGYEPEQIGGISEEDLVTITLPYIRTAREGVLRLGQLHERYGTSEMNAIGFSDPNEIWWFESIGGHHWMARRVPDDAYVTMPNQLGIDSFDFDDAYGAGKEYLCSADLSDFVQAYHLDLTLKGNFNPRLAFGSHSDMDHTYNTPRAWAMQRYFNPHCEVWNGPSPRYTPISDDLPWCRVPEAKITIEDIKEVLSNHYQTTPYDPYQKGAEECYRPIGVNRTSQIHILQLPPADDPTREPIQWISFASNVYNAVLPLFTQVNESPSYVSYTPERVSTDSFYWTNRLIGALADPYFKECGAAIDHYREAVQSQGHYLIHQALEKKQSLSADQAHILLESTNEAIVQMAKKESDVCLSKVLDIASNHMRNAFSRSDA